MYEDFCFKEELIEEFKKKSLKSTWECQNSTNQEVDSLRNLSDSESIVLSDAEEDIDILRRHNIDVLG